MKNTIVDRANGNTSTATARSKRQNASSRAATTTTWKSIPISSIIGVVSQPMHFPNRHYVTKYNSFLMIFNHNIESS